jgi:phosphate transport system substrate-binding protein
VKVSLAVRAVGISAVAAIGIAGCGSDSNGSTSSGSPATTAAGCAKGSLTADGSTFQGTIEQQWTSQFSSTCSGAQVTYTPDGSGAGIGQFGLGKVDFAGSDVTMLPTEKSAADKACGSTSLHVPVIAGGIAVIYNLKGVDGLQLDAPTLAKIFQGKITKWNDPAIKASNAGVSLPSTGIKVYWRNDGSGTSSVFSSFLDALAKGVWTLGASKQPAFPVGQGAAGSSGVVAGVKQSDGGITYAEISYAQQNNLPTAKVKNASGSYESISGQTVSDAIGSAFSITGSGMDLAGALDFAKMSGYPISTVSYALVCSQYKSSSKGQLVKDYLDYVLGDGQSQAASLGYAGLPTDLLAKSKASIDSIK